VAARTTSAIKKTRAYAPLNRPAPRHSSPSWMHAPARAGVKVQRSRPPGHAPRCRTGNLANSTASKVENGINRFWPAFSSAASKLPHSGLAPIEPAGFVRPNRAALESPVTGTRFWPACAGLELSVG
jgi:hypothetical protein